MNNTQFEIGQTYEWIDSNGRPISGKVTGVDKATGAIYIEYPSKPITDIHKEQLRKMGEAMRIKK